MNLHGFIESAIMSIPTTVGFLDDNADKLICQRFQEITGTFAVWHERSQVIHHRKPSSASRIILQA